jgi:hypothetical protein
MWAKGDDARSRQCHNEIIMPVAGLEGVPAGGKGWHGWLGR